MTQKAWWGSGTPGTRPLNLVCTQAAPCTFAQILAAFPNGGVLADLFPGFFGFKLGNGGTREEHDGGNAEGQPRAHFRTPH